MISYLKGTILENEAPSLVLLVNDIGYEVFASLNTCGKMPSIGETTSLYTHLVVREDAHTLYGFIDKNERALFLTLIKINGIGPKLALSILSSISPEHLISSIINQDAQTLVKLPGIGKKTAERIIVELKDKLDNMDIGIKSTSQPQMSGKPDPIKDAITALMSLGYKPNEASKAITQLDTQNKPSEVIIREALQALN